MEIVKAISDEEIFSCYNLLLKLRPSLNIHTFVEDIRRMSKESYQLACIKDSKIKAVIGYRSLEMFVTRKILYVDDLVTDEQCRSMGHGKKLLQWLCNEAKALGCSYIELDSDNSGVETHRFYKINGFESVAQHFSYAVEK